jgi:hypothetical protein
VSDLTLQLILKRIFQDVVQQLKAEKLENNPTVSPLSMTPREENGVRYMAGYVAFKMQKKCPSYADFFKTIHVGLDETIIETVKDYTRVWTEQVDRGGLFHVKDSFFEEIQMICRKYLDIRISPSDDIVHKIQYDVVHSPVIVNGWSDMTLSIAPDKHEDIKIFIKLWCNIRVHSFAKRWTETFDKGQKKSARKTLKRKGTDKEHI